MIPLHKKSVPGFPERIFCALGGLFGERVAHERAFAIAGGDDGVARGVHQHVLREQLILCFSHDRVAHVDAAIAADMEGVLGLVRAEP